MQSSSSSVGHPPPQALDAPDSNAWQMHAAAVESRFQHSPQQSSALASGAWEPQILKSSQLDAQRLDVELSSMLHEQFMKVFSHFPQNQVANYEPELHAIILLLVCALSVARGQATPGSQLLNLRYRNEWALRSRDPQVLGRSGVEGPGPGLVQRVLFGLGYVVLPYAWGRLGRLAAQTEWNQHIGMERPGGWVARLLSGERTWAVLRGLEATYKVSAFLNLAAFLRRGVYRSLLERAVGMRLVYQQACMTRVISFEYLNRQLVWQELSEVLLFMLPLLDVAKVKRLLASLLPRLPSPAALLSRRQQQQQQEEPGATSGRGEPEVRGRGEAWTSGPCPLCSSTELLLPFEALPCRHVFCYYCLRSNCEADSRFACPLDGVRVDAMRRWGSAAAVQ